MSNTRIGFFAFLFLPFVFLVSSCTWEYTSGLGRFDSRLRGTWVTNNPVGNWYTPGTLVISSNTITIYGYMPQPQGEDATIPFPVPFAGLPRGIPLSGYSENNRLFIDIPGIIYSVHYDFFDPGWNQPNVLFLTFGFVPAPNNREVLQQEQF